jgi:hypothetical protein
VLGWNTHRRESVTVVIILIAYITANNLKGQSYEILSAFVGLNRLVHLHFLFQSRFQIERLKLRLEALCSLLDSNA